MRNETLCGEKYWALNKSELTSENNTEAKLAKTRNLIPQQDFQKNTKANQIPSKSPGVINSSDPLPSYSREHTGRK